MSGERPATPAEALATLLEGNRRFMGGCRQHPNQDADRRAALAPGQHPFAVVFGCADSRLAAEIIFDRGLGDLFVVRTAGQVVGPEVLGSLEYGVEVLDAPLIAVLGHDSCGAIAAGRAAMVDGQTPSGFMREVVERVMLSLVATPNGLHDLDAAAEEHVRYTADLLVERSGTIARRVHTGETAVVGLFYRLVEGSVRVVVRHGKGLAVA